MKSYSELQDTRLGDIICLPDGRAMTARVVVPLPEVVGSMSGFVICGEMEILLSDPAEPQHPINVYVPIDTFPFPKEQCRVLYEGATFYWAPHLPSLSGAMAEVTFRIIEVRGKLDPVIMVWLGPELIVFIRATAALPEHLEFIRLNRSSANEKDVARHAAVVSPVRAPRPASAPAEPARKRREKVLS